MNMSKALKKDCLPKLQARYAHRNREGKSRMLDELCDDYGYERKYAIKVLSSSLAFVAGKPYLGPERRYDEIESVSANHLADSRATVRQALGPHTAAVAALLRTAL
jgi:hypothetical protein